MIQKGIRAIWFVSLFSTLYMVFSTYGDLLDSIYIDFLPGAPGIGRQTYFWWAIGIVTLVNLFVWSVQSVIRIVPVKLLPIPYRVFWLQDLEHQRAISWIYRAIFFAIGCAINYSLIVLMLLVNGANNSSGYDVAPPIFLTYLAGAMWLLTLVTPIWRLSVAKLDFINNSTN